MKLSSILILVPIGVEKMGYNPRVGNVTNYKNESGEIVTQNMLRILEENPG